jgi:hypothetical protein
MSITLKDIGSTGSLVSLANIIGNPFGDGGIEASPWYEGIRVRLTISGSRSYDDGLDVQVETYSFDEEITLTRVPVPSPDGIGGIPSPQLFTPDRISWISETDLQPGECHMSLIGTSEYSSTPGSLRMPPDPRRAMMRVLPLLLINSTGKIGEADYDGSTTDINGTVQLADPLPRSSLDDGEPEKKFTADVLTWYVEAGLFPFASYRAEAALPTIEADARDLRGHVFEHEYTVPLGDWDSSTVKINTEVEYT